MILYISGAMSAFPDDFNFPAFNRAAELLGKAGYEVVNPADKGIVEHWEWASYLRYDLRQMLDCDGVAVLPDSHNSRGAWLESTVALHLGMPIRSVEAWLAME